MQYLEPCTSYDKNNYRTLLFCSKMDVNALCWGSREQPARWHNLSVPMYQITGYSGVSCFENMRNPCFCIILEPYLLLQQISWRVCSGSLIFSPAFTEYAAFLGKPLSCLHSLRYREGSRSCQLYAPLLGLPIPLRSYTDAPWSLFSKYSSQRSTRKSTMMATHVNKGVVDVENSISGSEQEGISSPIAADVDTAGYDRSLTKHQIMMMTFGAGIGTGLWVGTGTALKYGTTWIQTQTWKTCWLKDSGTWWNCRCIHNRGVSSFVNVNLKYKKLTSVVTSSIVYLQYVSIGEMTAYRPVHGGFIRQFSEYIDPAMGFAGGINFWFEVSLSLLAT